MRYLIHWRTISHHFVVAVLLIFVASEVRAECDEDIDCPRSELCYDGVCKKPLIIPLREGSKLEPGTIKRIKGYLELSLIANIYTWGEVSSKSGYYEYPPFDLNDTATLDGTIAPGVRLAGYATVFNFFHWGGYLSFNGGQGKVSPTLPEEHSWIPYEDTSTILRTGFGLASKFGFRATKRLYLGLGIDLGLQLFNVVSWKDEYVFDKHTFIAVELGPKLVFDILLVDRGGRKTALSIAAGVSTVPTAQLELKKGPGSGPVIVIENEDGEAEEYSPEWLRFNMWHISPTVLIGFNFGR